MKKFISIIFIFTCSWLYAEHIDSMTIKKVIDIGSGYDVPESIVKALMHEESNCDPTAISKLSKDGFVSIGLFQIYTAPENLNYLLWKYWKHKRQFCITDPLDNAEVALHYLSDLHKYYKNWYKALLFYNHGNIETAEESTKAYARRIINAK